MLYIASDHAGFQLKKFLSLQLEKTLKLPFEDLGAVSFDKDDDFPDFATAVAKKVVKNKENLGILICGSGQGMCITANKLAGIRAIHGSSIRETEMGRKDNDANVLCLAARILSTEYALAIVKTFLNTNFDKQTRRIRRLKKISNLEK
ncbi:MAG: RpiB/LacA/LacB family sugar-phosphate isomerase [Patescibacteria group bacterium]